MRTATLRYGMTLNTGNFNNFKPEIEITVDLEGDIDEQIAQGVQAIHAIQPKLSEEMERILETEGLTGYESMLVQHGASIKNLVSKVKTIEKIIVDNQQTVV